VNFTHIECRVSYHKASPGHSLSRIDRGANGGVAAVDVHVIFKIGHMVDIWCGIDNHQCTNIDIGAFGGVIQTQKGPVIQLCTNMYCSTKILPFIPHVNLNGTRMMLMTNPLTFQGVFTEFRPWMHASFH
jgi:hypothetical protein